MTMLEPETLQIPSVAVEGGALTIAGYVAYQIGRLSKSVSDFLDDLKKDRVAEKEHRDAEVEHWKREEDAFARVAAGGGR
jgi:hypothetical protein